MEDINEDLIAAHLFSCQIPDPDLLIRPSGENQNKQLLFMANSIC